MILPSIPLEFMKPEADNPDKWDAKQLAKGVQNRMAQLGANGDGQLSFQEVVQAVDGLLGNGVLRMPTGETGAAVWATLAGPNGKMNARELAAALVTVDYDSNGTVSTAENTFFMNSISNGAVIAPSTVKGRYNDIDLKAQRIGLDAYLPKTGEVGYTKQLEEQLKGATKEEIKSGLAFSAEKLKTLQVEYDSMDLKTPEAQQYYKESFKGEESMDPISSTADSVKQSMSSDNVAGDPLAKFFRGLFTGQLNPIPGM
jgi:hypothetical protein